MIVHASLKSQRCEQWFLPERNDLAAGWGVRRQKGDGSIHAELRRGRNQSVVTQEKRLEPVTSLDPNGASRRCSARPAVTIHDLPAMHCGPLDP